MIDPRTTFCICDFETTGVDTVKDYPIEVGCVFTDSNFVVKGVYQHLILWDALASQAGGWRPEHSKAAAIHGIKVEDIQLRGRKDADIAPSIFKLVEEYSNPTKSMVLLSDNIQFEWAFMKRIMAAMQWPFHYCGWDSSLLLEMSGVGDPVPVHRALPDACLLQQALVRALERISNR